MNGSGSHFMNWFMSWEGIPEKKQYSLEELLIAYTASLYKLSEDTIRKFYLINKIFEMRQVLNWLTYDHTKVIGEIATQPSMTIPDMSMSIPELIDRYVHGLPLTGQKVPVYDGDEEVPDFAKMDFTELEEYKLNIQAAVDEYKAKQAEAAKKAEEAKLANAVQEELKKLKELERQQSMQFRNDEQGANVPASK